MATDAIVAVFTRAPIHGRVKRRLARALGDDGALAAHRLLLTRTLRRLQGVTAFAELELWVEGELGVDERFTVPIRRQPTGDLGMKMLSAVADIERRHARAIIVGSDCPLLDSAYVHAALAALTRHDVVIGPAEDGGYVLIACRRAIPALFQGIDWGTGSVLAMTLERAAAAGASVSCLPELWDVDEPADWQRFQQLLISEASG
jgi:rSAM/selenodomain-associated transferase 1